MASIKRDYKSSMFCMLLEDKKELLSLYNATNGTKEQAVECAVDECIKEGILEEFLRQNKAEAIAVSIFEYDQEAHMRCVRQEGYVEGKSEGKVEGKSEGKVEGKVESLLEILEELGTISDELCERIQREISQEQLKRWIKLAARVETLEEFINQL